MRVEWRKTAWGGWLATVNGHSLTLRAYRIFQGRKTWLGWAFRVDGIATTSPVIVHPTLSKAKAAALAAVK